MADIHSYITSADSVPVPSDSFLPHIQYDYNMLKEKNKGF